MDGKQGEITALDDIPMYHKIAVKGISKNERVIKYVHTIGKATSDIAAGMHVHCHNVISMSLQEE